MSGKSTHWRGWAVVTAIAFAVFVIAGVTALFTPAMPAVANAAMSVAAVFAIVTALCLVIAVVSGTRGRVRT